MSHGSILHARGSDQTVAAPPLDDDFGPDLLFKLHDVCLVRFLKIVSRLFGAYSTPPDPLAGFKGAYFSANLFTVCHHWLEIL